jgi:signal transduction histidine kinase
LALLILAMWSVRQQEVELLWLGLAGTVWFIRNYHFFAVAAPSDPFLFQQITYYSIYFAVAITLAFCAEFLKLPHRRTIIIAMLSVGLALSLVRFVLAMGDRTDPASSLMSVVLHGTFLIILFRHWWQHRTTEGLLVFLVLLFAALSGLHDIGRIPNVNWWDGVGFHFQPYVGFGIFVVFLLSLGRRFLSALTMVEETNAVLETRVAQATSSLAASEEKRHRLEMERALESERERLMQEMHDRVGSNLVTALSVAKNQGESPATIRTLKRAIDDLKITVDSLAPYEGDVVTLLGNLRHRMEDDLAEAGVATIWRVEECPELSWLDAPRALHLLRLVQEAISNVLAHAAASSILLECRPAEHEGAAGVVIGITDNGVGLSPDAEVAGKGITGMRQRARALGGAFSISSDRGSGARIALWLPLIP